MQTITLQLNGSQDVGDKDAEAVPAEAIEAEAGPELESAYASMDEQENCNGCYELGRTHSSVSRTISPGISDIIGNTLAHQFSRANTADVAAAPPPSASKDRTQSSTEPLAIAPSSSFSPMSVSSPTACHANELAGAAAAANDADSDEEDAAASHGVAELSSKRLHRWQQHCAVRCRVQVQVQVLAAADLTYALQQSMQRTRGPRTMTSMMVDYK